jgi:Zn-dependent protease with chaperone function
MDASKGICEISLNGAHLAVLVEGSNKADAKSIAGAVDAWRSAAGLPGDVEYSQQTDSAAAHYVFNDSLLGRTHADMSVDVPRLVSSVKQVLPDCDFALAVPRSSSLSGLPPAEKLSRDRTIAYWNITDGGSPVTAYTTLPVSAVVLFVCSVLVPVGLVLGAGANIARNRNLQPAMRRYAFQIMMWGAAFAATIVPESFAAKESHALDPILWLWFGTNSARVSDAIGISVTVVGVLAVVLFATRVNGTNDRGDRRAFEVRLAQSVANVAERMGIPAPQVIRTTKLLYAGTIFTRGRCIYASYDLADALDDSELDFMVAYALANNKFQFRRWRKWAAIFASPLCLIYLTAAYLAAHNGEANRVILGVAVVGTLLLRTIFSQRVLKDDVEADELAARTMTNPEAGMSALTKLFDTSKWENFGSVDIAVRIAALRRLKLPV